MRKVLGLFLIGCLIMAGIAWGQGSVTPSRIYIPYQVYTGPYLSAPTTEGSIRYNTSTHAFEYYNGSAWTAIVATNGNISGSSGSCIGNAATATTATNATNSGITDDTSTAATMYPTWVTANTGNLPLKTSSSKLTFNPSTGVLTSTGFYAPLASNSLNLGACAAPYQWTLTSDWGQFTAALDDAGDTRGILMLAEAGGVGGAGGAIAFGAAAFTTKPFAAIKGLVDSGSGNTTGGIGFACRHLTTDTTLTQYMLIQDTGVIQMAHYGVGAASFDASGNLASASDERLKDIQGLYKAGLGELRGIKPILYKWNKKSGMETEHTYAGFSAQNIQKSMPEAVYQNSDGILSFNDRAVLAAAVNAIKELKAITDKQEKRIKVLEDEVKKLGAPPIGVYTNSPGAGD